MTKAENLLNRTKILQVLVKLENRSPPERYDAHQIAPAISLSYAETRVLLAMLLTEKYIHEFFDTNVPTYSISIIGTKFLMDLGVDL